MSTTEETYRQLDAAVVTIGRDPNGCGELACCADTTKATNPKDAIGDEKLPLYLVPATAIAMYSLAHLNGGLKYGFWNWRKAGIRYSVYLNALRRHLSGLENGEEVDPDDGVPHEAAMGACLNIIIDARACGKLVDDRPPRIDIRAWFAKLTPHVKRLKELHRHRTPRHWTIADSEPAQVIATNHGEQK